ncbi:hypothetical protein [Vibrio diabolicus]|uniref:hypothetical protein n=1 Tax=Vibrio diabolicus TaxID=50719 RepID=UPI00215E8A2D|nr:hypothetical protein [Vibrio diabolicus]MCS0376834.1 hypothetical protein [Vibrio diabolicus]MCS0420707.1 hypothetical protein [Vibrio diabolicus]
MKFLGTFKQIFEAHEVKPHLRDIAMFVTLNSARLYPREQFDENGDIHPYLAPRLDLIKIIKQENSVKWFFTDRTYKVRDYRVGPADRDYIKNRFKYDLKFIDQFEQDQSFVTASPEALLRKNDDGKLFSIYCEYMLTVNDVILETKEFTLVEMWGFLIEVGHIYSQTESNIEKRRRHQEVIAECNKLEDDRDSNDENESYDDQDNELFEERL